MASFNGIINWNGRKRDFSIHLDENETDDGFSAEFFSQEQKNEIKIDGDIWKIDNVSYKVSIQKINDEILISGKEIPNYWHVVCPYLFQPYFFVGSNW